MRYRAFLSYASADRIVGERFQRAVEHYRIPKALRGSDRGLGPVPKRLTPIFRDRSDADASANLGEALKNALDRSDALIPLCTPAAARSAWVNAEIRHFKALGRGHRIFPVILDGTPRRFDSDSAPDGAFPPAIFERVDAAGARLPGDDPEPLAADLRPIGDGFDLAKLKVVAGLTGVPLTELTQRQFEAERRERTIVRSVAAGLGTLAVVAATAAVIAYRSAEEARLRLSNAIEMAARRVDDAARFGDEYGVPTPVIRQLLAGAERDFTTLIGNDQTGVPILELQRGRLLVLFSQFYRAVGDSSGQLGRARAAVTTLDRVPVRRQLRRPATWLAALPERGNLTVEQLGALESLALALSDSGAMDAEVQAVLDRGRTLAAADGRHDYVARFWSRLGELHYNKGDLAAARAAQEQAVAALDAYLASNPVGDGPVERAVAMSDRAELLLESERHTEALAEQAMVVAVFEARVAHRPNDAAALQGLGHALTRQADMRYAVAGTWTESIGDLERAIDLFERIYTSDRGRIDYARDLSIALERLGDVLLQTNDLARARPLFDRAVGLRRERLARDPLNGEGLRDLAVGLERLGDIALAERDPDRALIRFDEARSVRLTGEGKGTTAIADPVRDRDLAVLWYKTGLARVHKGSKQPWRQAYQTAIDLIDPLVGDGSAPPGWLRDLAVFRFAYGEALSQAGRSADARAQWTAALALIEKQLAINPEDPRLIKDREQLLRLLGGAVKAPAARR